MTGVAVPVSNFPAASALTGDEIVGIVQGGVTKRTTTGDIAGAAGGVTQVNGQTGIVVLTAADVGAVPLSSANIVPLNSQSGTSYALVLTDLGKCVEMNNASPNTLTVPANASVAFPVGSTLLVRQMGAGQTTIAAAGGVT